MRNSFSKVFSNSLAIKYRQKYLHTSESSIVLLCYFVVMLQHVTNFRSWNIFRLFRKPQKGGTKSLFVPFVHMKDALHPRERETKLRLFVSYVRVHLCGYRHVIPFDNRVSIKANPKIFAKHIKRL